MILGHFLSAGFVWTLKQKKDKLVPETHKKRVGNLTETHHDCNSTYIYLHLSVEPIIEQQVVSHADSVRLHGVPLTIVVISNIT